ncbi:MAG: hypothetical protein ABJF04_21965 [Reichenbachiella sp.]|uniref:hypothetical protein n=1 Tax=Reichenbachiella sp. TaxID=2184521 RepID=UPI00326338DE
MKKLGSLLLAVIFTSAVFTSCIDAKADEIYDNIVPEKSQDGSTTGGGGTSGPVGNP